MTLAHISTHSPILRCGRSSPPLPIAIQCWSLAEAKMIIDQLQPMLDQAPHNPLSHDLLSLFCESEKVRTMFNDHSESFFPVVVGQRVGIHRTRCNIQPNHSESFLIDTFTSNRPYAHLAVTRIHGGKKCPHSGGH